MTQDLLAPAIQFAMDAARASGLDISLCTIQVPSGNLTDNGFPDGTYQDVPGLVDIPCQVSPVSIANVSANTIKTLAEQQAESNKHVLLYGYYPAVETAWRTGGRAVIDGAIYPNEDILGVGSDSQRTQTRLALRVVTL